MNPWLIGSGIVAAFAAYRVWRKFRPRRGLTYHRRIRRSWNQYRDMNGWEWVTFWSGLDFDPDTDPWPTRRDDLLSGRTDWFWTARFQSWLAVFRLAKIRRIGRGGWKADSRA